MCYFPWPPGQKGFCQSNCSCFKLLATSNTSNLLNESARFWGFTPLPSSLKGLPEVKINFYNLPGKSQTMLVLAVIHRYELFQGVYNTSHVISFRSTRHELTCSATFTHFSNNTKCTSVRFSFPPSWVHVRLFFVFLLISEIFPKNKYFHTTVWLCETFILCT